MKIDVPFKVKLFNSLEEVERNLLHQKSQGYLYHIVRELYRDCINYVVPLMPNAELYEAVVQKLQGEWIVVGTGEAFHFPSFIILQRGRAVRSMPTIFLEVCDNPLNVKEGN